MRSRIFFPLPLATLASSTHAGDTGYAPKAAIDLLDLALCARAEKGTLGDVGNEPYLAARRSLRNRGN